MGKKNKQSLFNKLILLVNAGAIVALLLSYLAPFINPQDFWPIAFFGIAYLPILLLNLLFVIYWIVRKRLYALISLTLILLGWGYLRKHLGFHVKPSQEVIGQRDSASIRLLTYNVHLFKKSDGDLSLTNKEEIFDVVEKISPDVICFQEFYSRKKGKHTPIRELTTQMGYPYHYFYPTRANDYEGYGVAIFSRFPIAGSGYVPRSEGKRKSRTIYADLLWNGKKIRVYCVHLQSIGFQAEDYQFINNGQQSMDDEVLATRRIGQRLKWAFTHRGEEAVDLRRHADSCSIPYTIAGDFNDTPLSYSVSQVAKGMVNGFREKGSGWGVTYNGDFPNFQIDYILANPDFQVQHYQIVPKKLSDHNPVWADLQLVE